MNCLKLQQQQASRDVIGQSLKSRMMIALAADALMMVWFCRRLARGVLRHPDRGGTPVKPVRTKSLARFLQRGINQPNQEKRDASLGRVR